jgi:phosphinothricin acetyltransferase
MTVRDATEADAGPLVEMLNHFIVHTTHTFITEPHTLDDRVAWLAERSLLHPAIVVEIDGAIAAWGALSPHNPRGGYRHTADVSVYVHPDFHRRGIGRSIVTELIRRARSAGHHALIAGCCTESVGSIALHESLGFERVAEFREVGRKFERWLDVVYLELLL